MKDKLNVADNLLLIGVVAIVVFVAWGIFAAIVHTIIFGIKVLILVALVALGWRVVTAIGGGEKRRELNR